jgi:hypothetical protein
MDKESVDGSIARQVAALTYQSQLTANTAANTSVHQEQQLAHLATQQNLMHKNMYQIIAGLNAVMFNRSDKGRGIGRFAPRGFSGGYGGHAHGRGGRSYHGRGCSPSVFGFRPAGGFPPTVGGPPGVRGPPGFPQHVPPPTGLQAYCPPQGRSYRPMAQVAAPFSNKVKLFSNWNICYSCRFDVEEGHTSMMCPFHLCNPGHDVNFSRQNAHQYIDLGYPRSAKNCHKTTLPTM